MSPAYASHTRKVKLGILCLAHSLSTVFSIVFHRGRQAGSHCITATTCDTTAKQDNEGNARTSVAAPRLRVEYGEGQKSREARLSRGCRGKTTGLLREEVKGWGGDLLFTPPPPRETKCAAGSPNHHCLYETNFKSQTNKGFKSVTR